MKKLFFRELSLLLTLLVLIGCLSSCQPQTDVKISTEFTESTTSSKIDDTPIEDPSKLNLDTYKMVEFLTELYCIYNAPETVEAVDGDYLTAIRQYVASIGDKYATFYTDEEMAELIIKNSGDLCGIGISSVFDYDKGCIEIIRILDDAPAGEFLQVGDLIVAVKIEGEMKTMQELADEFYEVLCGLEDSKNHTEVEIRNSAYYYAYEKAIDYIRGEVGTYATVRYIRDGQEYEVSIIRAHITTQSIMYELLKTDNSIGLVRITQFDMTTYSQFKIAMQSLIDDGATRFIFDLRSNPGGSVEALNSMLSMLTPKNTLLYSTKDSMGFEEKVYSKAYTYTSETLKDQSLPESDIGIFSGYDMAILMDENSASASEIFAGSLRDVAGAVLIGHKSYGKGIIQSSISLKTVASLSAYRTYLESIGISTNVSGFLKITTHYDVLPLYGSFHTEGLEPDYYVDLTEEQKQIVFIKRNETNDDQVKKAVDVLNDKK